MQPELFTTECPICGGDAPPLGTLGSRTWHQCRNCGQMSSVTPEDAPERTEAGSEA